MVRLLVGIIFVVSFLTQVNSATNKHKPSHKLYIKGEKCLENDELDKAIDYFNQTLSLEPKHILSLQGLAEAHELKEDWSKAVKAYKRLNRIKPKNYKILLMYLHALERADINDVQMDVLKTLNELDRKDIVIAIKYLKILEANGVKRSHPRYITLLEDLSELPDSHVLFANMLGASQRQKTIEQDARRDISVKSKVDFRKKLSQIIKGERVKIDTAKIQSQIMGQIGQYPEDKVLLEALGILYLKQEKYTQAKIFFNNIKDPPISVLKYLGQIYFQHENYAKAIKKFNEISRDKMDVDTWELLVDALLSHKKKKQARKEAKALVKKFPESRSRISALVK